MKNLNIIGRIIGCIAFAAVAIPFVSKAARQLSHDVPEGYSYLAEGTDGDFYYAKLGGKFESVQVLNIHVIAKDDKVKAFPVPVDCGAREVGGKNVTYRTVGYKMMQRAC